MRISLYILLFIVLASCAQVKTPTGGSKDVLGPEIIESYPTHLETNYRAKSIAISFNELVKLSDPQNNIVITPPLKNKPEIYLKKGVTLIISLNDTLQENTTYTVNLGEAIVDNNESNPLTDKLLVFSTGDVIDSLSFSGNVSLSANDTPCDGCKVMLYRENDDSIVYKERPYYFAKSNENGQYQFDFLRAGDYKVVALLDENNDFLFNPDEDQIGFQEELFTVELDTAETVLNMSVFKEHPLEQNLESFKLINDQNLQLNFVLPVENLSLLKDSSTFPKDQYIAIYDDSKDTLNIWLKETPKKNTEWKMTILDDDVALEDISIFFTEDTSEFTCLSPKNNGVSKGSIRDTIELTWSNPIAEIKEEKFRIKLDSLDVNFSLKKKDDFTIDLMFEKNENDNFSLKVDSFAVTDIYGNNSDSLGHSYLIQEETYFGNLRVISDSNSTNSFAILKNVKGQIARSEKINIDGKIIFSNLEPGEYTLLILEDKNGNLKWDTGNYLLKKRPEKTIRFKEPITIRSNWDLDINLSQ